MQSQQAPIQVTAWAIWFAILSGLVVIQLFVGGGFPSEIDHGKPSALQQYLPAVPALLALVGRVLVIPRISTSQNKLTAMVIGLALAEATGLLGIFLVDKEYGSTKLAHFVLSILVILTMAPVYLKNAPALDRDTR